MGKRKSLSENEMSAILSQLQKTYGMDGESDSDEDIFDSEPSYEDTELSDLLAKIISENTLADDGGSSQTEASASTKKRKEKNELSTDIQSIIMSEEYTSLVTEIEEIDEEYDSEDYPHCCRRSGRKGAGAV